MNASKWRIWAKTVAVIDLIFVIVILLASIARIIFTFAGMAVSGHHKEFQALAWTLRITAIIMLILTGFGLRAAVRLIIATNLELDAGDAYKYTRHWLLVNVVLIGLYSIFGCVMGEFMWTAVGSLIQLIFIVIVFLFMQDAKTAFRNVNRMGDRS